MCKKYQRANTSSNNLSKDLLAHCMSPHTMKRNMLFCVLLIASTGCAVMKELPTPDQATAIEQLLVTQAIEKSLEGKDAFSLPLPEDSTIKLETTGLANEHRFLIGAVGRWLGEQGLRLAPDEHEATYNIQILVQSLGTEQSRSFFGMPPVQSVLIPFSLPEISLYAAHYQSGYSRFRLDIFEAATGQFLRSTPWLQASTFYNEYTLLFFIDFHRTDLVGPFEDPNPVSKLQDDEETEDEP